MSRYELTINPTYVPDWKIWEALRELAQNAFDRETEGLLINDPNLETPNPFGSSITYTSTNHQMIFSNTNSSIPKSSLLLGTTTKADVKTAIGAYGEGYKLSMLVLTRMGCRVTILNGKEEWSPKIIKSRRYQSDLLVVDTCRAKKEHSELSFVVDGITPSMYGEFAQKCLALSYPTDIMETPMGNILLEESQKGKIYCGGLYVQDVGDEDCAYGYDIKPAHLELDRDRRQVSSWNLYWKTSEMYSSLRGGENSDFVYQLIRDNCPDIQYFNTFSSHRKDDMYKDICEQSYSEFIEKYSVNAIPVKSEEDAKLIKEKYNHLVPVIVTEKIHTRLVASPSYTERMTDENINTVITPESIIGDFIKKYQDEMNDNAVEALEHIHAMSRKWK